MATAQVLRAAHTVDDRVRVVEDKVLEIDSRVVGVDDKVVVVIDGAQPSLISHQGKMFNSDVPRGKRDKGSHTTSGRRHGSSEMLVIFFLRRHWSAGSIILTGNQLRYELRKWLSPSDPSINHNIACGAHRKQRAEWFFQGSIFTEWKSNGSLLWLHGKRTFSYISSATTLMATSCSGLREERTLVCPYQLLSTFSYSPPD